MLAQDLELYSKDEKAEADLGAALCDKLNRRLAQLKSLCRKHFGAAYVSLAPLSQLNLDQIDQSQVIVVFDRVIAHIEQLPSQEMVALDAEGVAVLHDMLAELRGYRAAIAEADTEDFRAILENRFAQNSGALGLALGKLCERSLVAAGNVSRGADIAIKNYERGASLVEIVSSVGDMYPGGTS